MTPLPSIYKGYHCRSRLEARWLCFLDTLGMEFIYEPEGFKFEDGTCYLPDLYFPKIKTWGEIKPFVPDDDSLEFRKIRNIVIWSEQPLLLLDGSPEFRTYWRYALNDAGRLCRFKTRIDIKERPIHRAVGVCSLAFKTAVYASRALRFDSH